VVVIVLQAEAFAQLPTADLSRIQPRSAKAGETVEVNLSGKNLEELTELRFTHAGITAKPVLLPADEFFPAPRINGSKFSVTIAANVPAGIYEARAVGYFGLSTARPFVVAAADSNEIDESKDHSTRETAMDIPVNSILNGSVPYQGIDWYKFSVKSNQRVLVEINAERIDSRMDGLLIAYDSSGREIGRNREHYGRDPFLEIPTTQAGEFYVAVSDILYRGGPDHFYRLSISDNPHIDYIFPPAGEPGSKNRYTLYGRNLPGGKLDESVVLNGRVLESLNVEIAMPSEPSVSFGFFPGTPRQGLLRGLDYRLKNSNVVRLGFSSAPVVVEDPNQPVQEVTLPVEVAARFDQANDEDVYRFSVPKGKTYWIEATADRMASNVNPYLIVHEITKDKAGRETRTLVAENDDLESFFSVHGKDSINADTTDAAIMLKSENGGVYSVTVINQFGGGSTADLYRLAIREAQHDFQLIATTERALPTNRTGYSVTPHLRRGAKWGIRVLAPRQDGFEGDIVIAAQGLPPGVTAQPLTLSGKTDRGVLVVSADATAKSWSGEIHIVGRAKSNDRELVREARFASLIWGHIFSDSIRVRSRLTTRVPLSVNEFESAPVILSAAKNKQWTVEVGQKLEIPIKVIDNGSRKGNLTIEPHALFGMLRSPPTVNIAENATEGTLTIDFRSTGNFKVKPGRYQFALLGVGVAKYQPNLQASVLAEAERKRIEKLVADLKSKSDGTKETADRLAQAEKAKVLISKAAESAKKRAAEQSAKFAAWSNLITVTVLEPAKK